MNYIGSKYKLLPFIHSTINNVIGADISNLVFCDIFAGTGIVGRSFKQSCRSIIANDNELYSYVLNKNYIGNREDIPHIQELLEELNTLTPQEGGFIFNNYCLGGGTERQYFSDSNGKKIDAIRTNIENWRNEGRIGESAYYYLLCSLLEAADKVANTASVYGAFLKHLKKSAAQDLVLRPAAYDTCKYECKVFQKDANLLIKEIEGDILYLDPPYNARQYGANYHLLNTIVEYKPFLPKGKTGMRDYSRSKYCSTRSVSDSFEDLLRNASFRYIFLSYNNEGLMSSDEIKKIMSKYGTYDLVQCDYQRFKADKTENRNHRATSTIEYLHILEKP